MNIILEADLSKQLIPELEKLIAENQDKEAMLVKAFQLGTLPNAPASEDFETNYLPTVISDDAKQSLTAAFGVGKTMPWPSDNNSWWDTIYGPTKIDDLNEKLLTKTRLMTFRGLEKHGHLFRENAPAAINELKQLMNELTKLII